VLGVMRGNRFAASDRHLGRSGAALRLEGPQIADILTRVRVSVRGRGRVNGRVRVQRLFSRETGDPRKDRAEPQSKGFSRFGV